MVTPETIDQLRLLAGLGPYDDRMMTADGASGIGKQLPHGSRGSA